MSNLNKQLNTERTMPKINSVNLEEKSVFYFGKSNYRWMLIGLGFIILGYLLMLGQDANTRPDGTFDPNYWNEGIFSFHRIRIAPFLVVVGFAIEAYAILLKKKK